MLAFMGAGLLTIAPFFFDFFASFSFFDFPG